MEWLCSLAAEAGMEPYCRRSAACLKHVKTVRERRELRCLNNTRSEINLHPIILLNKEAITIKETSCKQLLHMIH
jgi:hypothetical protein